MKIKGERVHNAFASPPGAHITIAVVGIAAEGVAPPLQFPVQIIPEGCWTAGETTGRLDAYARRIYVHAFRASFRL